MLHNFGGREGDRSGLSVKKPGVVPMWARDISSWLQKGSAAAQTWAPQQHWWHLCDSIFMESEKTRCSSCERKGSVKHLQNQPCRHQGEGGRRGKRCSRCWSRGSPAASGEGCNGADCPPAAHGGGQLHGGAGEHALKESAVSGKEPLPGAFCLEGAAVHGSSMLELLLKNCAS